MNLFSLREWTLCVLPLKGLLQKTQFNTLPSLVLMVVYCLNLESETT